MDICASAGTHGVDDSDILHAVEQAVAVGQQEDGKVLYLGPDRAGNLLEIVSVVRENGTEIVITRCDGATSYSSARREPQMAETTHGRSEAGVDLTDEVLERMAEEAEAGLDVTKLRRRPGRPAMGSGPADALPVRLDPELRRAVDDRAAADHTTASDVVRAALRRYLKAG